MSEQVTGPGHAPAAAVTVRNAEPADAERIAMIYNEGMRHRVATFETSERSAGDVLGWLQDTTRHPILVAVDEREGVLGWIRAYTYRPRACYDTVAEWSVYVSAEARGRRVGDVLMAAFIIAAREAGLTKLVSRIFPENSASRALCARHGFREVGTYEKHGRLDGVWRDVVIVERLIRENMG